MGTYVGYGRISRDQSREGTGVERQRELCERKAKQIGWGALASWHEDNDVSASTNSTKPRPAYRALLDAASRGEIDGIISYSTSRLTRRVREWLELIDLAQSGVEFVFVNEGTAFHYDLSTARGRKQALDAANDDQFYAESITELVQAQKRQAAHEGKAHKGGMRAYGYAADKVTIIPKEAAIIREMADRVLRGESRHSIVNDLNKRKVKSAQNVGWDGTSFKRLLQSPRIAGITIYKGKVLTDVKAEWEPIITPEQHEAIKRRFAERVHNQPGGVFTYPLSAGITKCGVCDEPMYGKARDGVRRYACTGCTRLSIAAEPFETFIHGAIVGALDGEDLARALSQRRSSDAALAKAVAAVAAARERLEALEMKWALDEVARTAYTAAKARRIRELEEATTIRDRITGVSALEQLPTADTVRKEWAKRGADWQRAVVRSMVSDITVKPRDMSKGPEFHPNRIKIEWSF